MPVGQTLAYHVTVFVSPDPIQAAREIPRPGSTCSRPRSTPATVSEEALSCIQQHVDRFRADDFFPESADRAALLKFLKPRKVSTTGCPRCDCGLLGRVFPEFQAISWRVVRDFYLKCRRRAYAAHDPQPGTHLVDRGTYRFRFRNILNELDRSELLVLALLLHDVGKWRDDDHASSIRMAMEAVERLDLGSRSPANVLFLIHTFMSLVAFRRDAEDPEIVKEFSAFIGSEERLKMLTLMTLVDVEAVSPETLTSLEKRSCCGGSTSLLTTIDKRNATATRSSGGIRPGSTSC